MGKKGALLAAVFGLGLSGAVQAALFDRGGGLIYSDTLNITWLADANYSKTAGYDADGAMNWNAAMEWAANLSYYDSVRGVTYNDWRLPLTEYVNGVGPCVGNCAGNEMAQLIYTDGSVDFFTQSILESPTLKNYFTNMQAGTYWLGLPYVLRTNSAWKFETTAGGGQGGSGNGNEFFAWAVRSGDVAAVPEPETYALMLLGLGIVGLWGRKNGCCSRLTQTESGTAGA